MATPTRRRGELDDLNGQVHVAEVKVSDSSRIAGSFFAEQWPWEGGRSIAARFLPSKLETKALGEYEPWAAESEAALASRQDGTLAVG